MNDKDVERIVGEYALQFPPLIDFRQAAEIGHTTLKTIHDYSSRKLFDGFRTKVGRRILLDRAAFVAFILNRDNRKH